MHQWFTGNITRLTSVIMWRLWTILTRRIRLQRVACFWVFLLGSARGTTSHIKYKYQAQNCFIEPLLLSHFKDWQVIFGCSYFSARMTIATNTRPLRMNRHTPDTSLSQTLPEAVPNTCLQWVSYTRVIHGLDSVRHITMCGGYRGLIVIRWLFLWLNLYICLN